jgi:hypothetical protein
MANHPFVTGHHPDGSLWDEDDARQTRGRQLAGAVWGDDSKVVGHGRIILLTPFPIVPMVYSEVKTMNPTYSTIDVARAINVDKSTLLRWLRSKKIAEPTQKTVAGVMIRVWSEKDLERAKKYREERYYQRP